MTLPPHHHTTPGSFFFALEETSEECQLAFHFAFFEKTSEEYHAERKELKALDEVVKTAQNGPPTRARGRQFVTGAVPTRAYGR